MKWEGLPTQIRRTVDEAVEASGLAVHRSGDPVAEGRTLVIPFEPSRPGVEPVEVVVALDGSATVRAAA